MRSGAWGRGSSRLSRGMPRAMQKTILHHRALALFCFALIASSCTVPARVVPIFSSSSAGEPHVRNEAGYFVDKCKIQDRSAGVVTCKKLRGAVGKRLKEQHALAEENAAGASTILLTITRYSEVDAIARSIGGVWAGTEGLSVRTEVLAPGSQTPIYAANVTCEEAGVFGKDSLRGDDSIDSVSMSIAEFILGRYGPEKERGPSRGNRPE